MLKQEAFNFHFHVLNINFKMFSICFQNVFNMFKRCFHFHSVKHVDVWVAVGGGGGGSLSKPEVLHLLHHNH